MLGFYKLKEALYNIDLNTLKGLSNQEWQDLSARLLKVKQASNFKAGIMNLLLGRGETRLKDDEVILKKRIRDQIMISSSMEELYNRLMEGAFCNISNKEKYAQDLFNEMASFIVDIKPKDDTLFKKRFASLDYFELNPTSEAKNMFLAVQRESWQGYDKGVADLQKMYNMDERELRHKTFFDLGSVLELAARSRTGKEMTMGLAKLVSSPSYTPAGDYERAMFNMTVQFLYTQFHLSNFRYMGPVAQRAVVQEPKPSGWTRLKKFVWPAVTSYQPAYAYIQK